MLLPGLIASSIGSSVRRVAAPPDGETFPLSVHGSGRYLVGANGQPFLLHGDTPWSLALQSPSDIDTYLEDRAARGYTTVLFEAIEHKFGISNPWYRNYAGQDPFTSMTNFAAPNAGYWANVDYIVNKAKALGLFVLMNPAYLGNSGTGEGWEDEVSAESDSDLQSYGAFLANRYTQGNVGWCLGGDQNPGTTLRNKQWNIVTGIRSVRTTDIIMSHPFQPGEGYTLWNGYAGWNLNTIYTYYSGSNYIYQMAATAYARTLPVVMMEAVYEQEQGSTAAQLRMQTYQSYLSGCCGHFFGNNPIWNFESPNALFSYSGTWESNLNSTGNQQQTYAKALFDAFDWWKLQPQTGTALVTTSLSSGTSRICPALSSDGTFALIWVPSSQTVTVVLSAMAPSLVRVRLYNTSTGAYTTHTASTANSGSLGVATGGERVIVLDAA